MTLQSIGYLCDCENCGTAVGLDQQRQLVADVKTTLELTVLELEELPFTNAAVVHNRLHSKELFEEKMKLWAELMAEQAPPEEQAGAEGGEGVVVARRRH